MANRKNKAVDRERFKPSMALNAICPYYTMFPLSFPISVLGRFGKRKLRVADPFCGRGTTIFAARLKGHQAYGIDASPIAIAIARAKLAETTDEEVLDLAEKILESQPTGEIAERRVLGVGIRCQYAEGSVHFARRPAQHAQRCRGDAAGDMSWSAARPIEQEP